MLRVQATPRLMGVEVTGDYLDLKQLYELLLSMIADPDKRWTKGKKGQNSDPNIYLEGLIFEIRSTYRGERNILAMENGAEDISKSILNRLLPQSIDADAINRQFGCGNLYYSFRIPFLDAFGYLFVMYEKFRLSNTSTDLIRLEKKNGIVWLQKSKYIELFMSLLWDALCQCIGEQHCREFRLHVSLNPVFSEYDFRYIDLLSTYYMSQCPNMTNQKKTDILYAMIRLMLKMEKKAEPALHRLKGFSTIPEYSGFGIFMEKQVSISENGEVYMEEIYGQVDWKYLSW